MEVSMQQNKDIRLTFTNYNYAFNNFYDNYKDTCLKISEKTKINEILEIRRLVSTFIYEYDYSIDDPSKKKSYRDQLKEIRKVMSQDEEISRIMNKDFSIISNQIEYQNKYYYYFLMYLDLFGKFISELTETFMPNTNVQKKQLKFSNNQAFFEKFTQHKRIVMESLTDFKISEFSRCYNKMITFYYAYSLFINNSDRNTIDNLFSLLISFYLNRKNLNLLLISNPSPMQISRLQMNSQILNDGLLFINSIMNHSFSSYDVLPKIQKKVYVDRTLI